MQDVAGEGILLAGGAAAILLQVADPRVAAGVARHSDFAQRPLDRLHGTLTYLYVLAYGTPEEQQRVARRVGEPHRPVPGARDAELQRWVAATLYWTAARIHSLVLDPVDDELYAEYARIGTALGMPATLWPADRAAFDEYFAAFPCGDSSVEEAQVITAEVQAAKAFICDGAPRVADRALALSGGAGYMASHPLAKAWRDARAGAFMHPFGANRAYELVARTALGLDPRPEPGATR